MEIIYLQQALEDLAFWKRSRNKNIQKRISKIIESIETNPFAGIGKPEPLRYNHAGKWS